MAKLIAHLGINTTSYETGIKRTQGITRKISREMGRSIRNNIGGAFLAAFSVRALTRFSKEIVSYGAKIHDLGKQFNTSTDTIQEFGYAAEQSGTSVEFLAQRLTNLSRRMQIALEKGPGNTYFDAFQKLGITIEDMQKSRPEEVFRKIARNIEKVNVTGREIHALTEVFSVSGSQLVAVFKNGLDAAIEFAQKGKFAIENDMIVTLKELDGQLTDIGYKFRTVGAKALLGGIKGMRVANAVFQVLARGGQFAEAGAAAAMKLGDMEAEKVIRILNAEQGIGTPSTQTITPPVSLKDTGSVQSNVSGLGRIGIFNAQREINLRKVMDKIERNTSKTAANTAEIARSEF